ncbi:MAG: hypothetical protein GY951_05325 [Psychromonas sp.]|nr:hypothetical protein [Psychromonas sp.]
MSELTNIALMIIERESELQPLQVKLQELQNLTHYKNAETQFIDLLEADLINASDYWQEPWRYNSCWPVIQSTLKHNNFS